jgi:hypothetical protein
MLERDPLNENADATRRWLREWTIEVPDIGFHVCNELLSHGLGENYPYSREINLQTIFSGAVFTLEHQNKMRDDVGAYIAGVEGSLRMYEVLAKSKPDARSAFLDDLIAMRDRGVLADHVAKLAAEKCPRSNMMLIAAPVGAGIGLILGSLIGWLAQTQRPKTFGPRCCWEGGPQHRVRINRTVDRVRLCDVLRDRRCGPSLSRARIRSAIQVHERICLECPWLAHDHNILRAWAGSVYRRSSSAKPLPTVAECAGGIRPSGSGSRLYMYGRSIPGIPTSRCGWCDRPTQRDHGSTAFLMELPPGVGLALHLPRYSFIALGMLTALLSMVVDVAMPGLQQRIFLFLILVWISIVAHRLARVNTVPLDR